MGINTFGSNLVGLAQKAILTDVGYRVICTDRFIEWRPHQRRL
jgi:UDP-glucose 6-dehydrogenase